MAEPAISYRKLPGRGRLTRLWISDDHIISVASIFGMERYRRFFFSDIEAIMVRRTRTRLVWNVILTVIIFGAILLGGVIYGVQSRSGRSNEIAREMTSAFLGIPALIAAFALVVNTLRGPTVEFWVKTSGGLEHLDAPSRLGPARRVLKILGPQIEAFQRRKAHDLAA